MADINDYKKSWIAMRRVRQMARDVETAVQLGEDTRTKFLAQAVVPPAGHPLEGNTVALSNFITAGRAFLDTNATFITALETAFTATPDGISAETADKHNVGLE